MRKYILPIIAVFVIAVLIFLPDILGIHSVTIEDQEKLDSEQVEPGKKEALIKENEREEKPAKSNNLDQIEEEYLGSEREKNRSESTDDPAEEPAKEAKPKVKDDRALGPRIGQFLSGQVAKGKKSEEGKGTKKGRSKKSQRSSSTSAAPEKVSFSRLNDWEYIRSEFVQKRLKAVLVQVDDLSDQLKGTDYSLSKQVLREYTTELAQLIDHKQGVGSTDVLPRDIFNQLEKLDLRVLTRLLQEDAPRSLIVQWYKIDLSDFYNSGRVQGFKSLAITNFNPRLQIHEIIYYLREDAWQSTSNDIANLEVSLVLLKDSIKSIKLFKNNLLVQELTKSVDYLTGEWSFVTLKIDDLDANYLVEVTDNADNKVSKIYNFNKAFDLIKTKLLTYDKDQLIVKTAHLRDNFASETNYLDQHYLFEDPLQKELTEEFPNGEFERF